MPRLATAEDFEGLAPQALYTAYRRYPFFAERATAINARYTTKVKALVAGCGYGYLVDELVKLGWDAWGIDASAYAITKGKAELPAIATRLIQADAGNASQMSAVRTAAGLTGNRRFGLIVTEDILPVCTDAEANTILQQLRANLVAGGPMLHIITPGNPADPAKFAPLNWKSVAQWRALIGNVATESILGAESMVIS